MKKFIFLNCLILSMSLNVAGQYSFGDGKDLDLNVSNSVNFNVDDVKRPVTSFLPLTSQVPFDEYEVHIDTNTGSGGFASNTCGTCTDGDLVIIIQMEESNMSSTVGNYVIARVSETISANSFKVKIPNGVNPVFNCNYPDKVQIIRIHEYRNLFLYGILTCDPYNQVTGLGGVVCIVVSDTLFFNYQTGIIEANGKGYPKGSYNGVNYGIAGTRGLGIGNICGLSSNQFRYGGFTQYNPNSGNGLDGCDTKLKIANAFGQNEILLLADSGQNCTYSIDSQFNYDPGDGSPSPDPQDGLSGSDGNDGTTFPLTDFGSSSFNDATGPIYLGNCGKGGNGGKGSGSGGNGGGGAGSGYATYNPGFNGQFGSIGVPGADGGDGGNGGGIVIVRAKNIVEINGTDSTFNYIQAEGERGASGQNCSSQSGGKGGNGGNGANAPIPDYLIGNVFLPGRGGEAGQSGTGADGGNGGKGGDGGSVLITTYNSGLNFLTNDNISTAGGPGGNGGDFGLTPVGYRGTDGEFYDLAQLEDTYGEYCHYVKYFTKVEDCECDYIFYSILPQIDTSTLIQSGANIYQFETTTNPKWICEYNPSTSLCQDGRMLVCNKTIIIEDGTHGKKSPIVHYTTSKRCHMKQDTTSDMIWNDLFYTFNDTNYALNLYQYQTTPYKLIIKSDTQQIPYHEFKYVSDTLYQSSISNRFIETCCEPSWSEDTNDLRRWGNRGQTGLSGNTGGSKINNDDITNPILKKGNENISDTMGSIPTQIFEFYPIPASNFLYIKKIHEYDYPVLVLITDTKGKILIHFDLDVLKSNKAQKIDISKLSSGIYVIQIINKPNNKVLQNLKFFKN